MHPTPLRRFAGTTIVCAAFVIAVSITLAQEQPKVRASATVTGSAAASASASSRDGVVIGWETLPASAVLGSAVASLTPAGGKAVTSPLGKDGSFSFKGLKPGAYEFRISFASGPRQSTSLDGRSPATDPNTKATVPKQTQGATFGEKVDAGLATAGNAKTKHDTAKNSIGNIRAHEEAQAGGVQVAVGDVKGDGHAAESPTAASAKIDNNALPNRISMNVTTPKRNFTVVSDGSPVVVQVGADGRFGGRARVQAQQGAEPASSGRTAPDPAAPSGGTPPRPTGG